MTSIAYTEQSGRVNLPVASINDLNTDIAALKAVCLNSSGKVIEAAAGDGNRCIGITLQAYSQSAYNSPTVLTPAPDVISVLQAGRIKAVCAASEAAALTSKAFLINGSGTSGAVVQADLGQPVFLTAGRTLKVNPADSRAPYFGRITKVTTVGTNADGECEVEFDFSPRPSVAMPVSTEYHASTVDKRFFTANRRYRVLGIRGTVTVAGTNGSAVTATVRKVPSGTAIGSGTALHSGTMDLKGTADTVQSLTLSTTAATLLLDVGDSLALDVDGTLTDATGAVTVDLVPID